MKPLIWYYTREVELWGSSLGEGGLLDSHGNSQTQRNSETRGKSQTQRNSQMCGKSQTQSNSQTSGNSQIQRNSRPYVDSYSGIQTHGNEPTRRNSQTCGNSQTQRNSHTQRNLWNYEIDCKQVKQFQLSGMRVHLKMMICDQKPCALSRFPLLIF